VRRSGLRKSNVSQMSYRYDLSICVGRQHNFRDWLQLIVFVEFYLAQGVQKLIFYHHSYTRDVERVLRAYQRDGVVEIFPFPPMQKLVHETEDVTGYDHNTLLNTNVCPYFLMGRSQYVAMIDADEFLWPVARNETLLQIIQRY